MKLLVILLTILGLLAGCGISREERQKATLHLGIGFHHIRQGDATSALREFLEAEKYNPEDADIQYGLGWAYSAKGLFLQALQHFRRVLELNSKYTEAHNAMGAVYLEMKEWDKAIQEFDIVLGDLVYMTPHSAWNNKGWAYYQKRDYPRAIECFQRAIALKHDFGMPYYNLGLCYRDSKQAGSAIQAFRAALRIDKTLVDGHFQLGVLLLESGEQDEACKSFQEVVRLAPNHEKGRLAQQYLEVLKKSGR